MTTTMGPTSQEPSRVTGSNDANYKGVAPAAGLVGIKVLDDRGRGRMQR